MEESFTDLAFDVFARNCPSRPAFEHITGRWGSIALMALDDGALRFGVLRRRVEGVSEKMLSQTLQALERDGFVLRDVVTTIPPRVEYSLTPLGVETARRMRDLIEFLESRMPEVLQAQVDYDSVKASG
jgi:DNA-binding HxlR family transcriptional regulator